MRACGRYHENVNFFLVFCFQTVLNFFYQMISFLTLKWMHGDGTCGDGSLFLVFCFQMIAHFFVDHMTLFAQVWGGENLKISEKQLLLSNLILED